MYTRYSMLEVEKNIKSLKSSMNILKALVGVAFLGICAFVFVPYMRFVGANAEEISINVVIDDFKLAMNTDSNCTGACADGGNVNFPSINTSEEGMLAIARKDITVDTNAKYYMVYLSSSSSQQALCRASGSENCMTSIGAVEGIDGATGGVSKPMKFSAKIDSERETGTNLSNTWGYAVTNFAQNTSDTSIVGDFASAGTYYIDNREEGGSKYSGYALFPAASAVGENHWNTKWAQIATVAKSKIIRKGDTELENGYSSSNGNDGIVVCNGNNSATCNSEGPAMFSVYYGTKVDNSLVMGEYTNTVLYTAVASLRDISNDIPENAYLSRNFGGAGDELKISLNMTSTVSLSSNNIQVYMVDHDTYASSFGAIGSGTAISDQDLIRYGLACPINSIERGKTDGEANSEVVISCTVPALGTGIGSTGIATELADLHNKSYDFIVSMPSYNIKFTTRFNNSQVGFRYVGLQSKNNIGEHYVTNMQQMTPGICAQTTEWNVQSGWIYGASATERYWVPTTGADGLSILDVEATYGTEGNNLPFTTYFDGAAYHVASGGATLGEFEAGDAFFGTYNPKDGHYYKTIARNYDTALADVAGTEVLSDNSLYSPTTPNPHQTGNFSVESTGNSNYTNAAHYYWTELTNGQRWEWDLYNNRQWTLTDTRDGKGYIVRKLADNNCWMVQNLDLELTTNTVLSDADSDINTYRKPDGTMFSTSGAQPTEQQIADQNLRKSWSPAIYNDDWKTGHALTGSAKAERGDYVITQREGAGNCVAGSTCEYGVATGSAYGAPGNWSWQQNGGDGSHAYSYSEYRFTTTNTSKPQIGCTVGGVVDTTGECNPAGGAVDYFINYGSTTQSSVHCTELVNGACTPGTGNSGTWYNHTAATAGSSMGHSDGTAEDSICPKGWMLPTYDGNKSYYNLIINVYGGIVRSGITNSQADGYIINQPLSFLRSGYYNWESASRSLRGSNGLYWESHFYSGTYSDNLGFYSTYLRPQGGSRRGLGFSVRCVSALAR